MPELRRCALALVFAALGLLLCGGRTLAFDEQYGEVKSVQCTVRYNWPKYLYKGYFPVEIRLANGGESDVVVSLRAQQNWAEEDSVRRRVALEAGETLEFELLLRSRTRAYSQYIVTFEVGSDDVEVGGAGPPEHPRTGSERLVLYAAAKPTEAGKDEAWSEEWSKAQGASSSGHGHQGVLVTARTFAQLSPTWQAYTSLDTVILDLEGGLPDPEDLAATLAWCRSGGKLMLAGVTSDKLWELPGFADQFEGRLRIDPEDSDFDEKKLVAYRCGFGVLIVQRELPPAPSLMDDDYTTHPVGLVADSTRFTPPWTRPSFGRSSRQHLTLDEVGNFANLPLRSLMLLIIGFALLMGPVNFLWVKRTKKPMMLLVSVPAIALVTSVTLVLYGVFSQGLDVKTMSRTWSILDQRNGWSTTAEVRRVFAGSSPAEGLRPEAGTLIYPERSYWRGTFNQGKNFTLDLDEGRLYGGDYFPIRRPFGQLVLSDRAARLRLETREADGAVEVTNALGSTLRALLLCGADGRYHFLDGELGEGASARLVEGGFSAKRVQWESDIDRVWGETAKNLLPGTYIAQLDDAPLRDDCGIEVNEIEGRHVLVGILDVTEGARQ